MLAAVALSSLLAAVAAFLRLSARERRLAAGHGGAAELAAWTGLTGRDELLAIQGVRETREGALHFDPHFLDALPPHPFESYLAHGLCIAVSLLGSAAGSGEPPALLTGLVILVAAYQLLGCLGTAIVRIELRHRG